MTIPLSDLTPRRAAAAIDANLGALYAAFATLPGAELTRGPGLTRLVAPLVSPMFNGVIETRLDDAGADAAIADTISYFRARRRPYFFWWTSDATAPGDLGDRLRAAGLLPFDLDAPAMFADLATVVERARRPENVSVSRVGDEQALQTWSGTFCAAYEVPSFAGESWVQASLALGLDRLPWRLYLARLEGEPVGTAMIFDAAGVAAVMALATMATVRRRGVGSALMATALADSYAAGYRTTTLWSTPMGESLYRRLGYAACGTISRYLWRGDG